MNKNIYTKNTAEIGYYGEVSIKLKNGDTIIDEHHYHNRGHNTLFKFLCSCIAGNYIDADRLRPMQLKAFVTTQTLQNVLGQSDKELCESNNAKTTYITIDKPPIVQPVLDNANNITGYSVTLHFMIPYLYLIAYPGNENIKNEINYLLLFANIPATKKANPEEYLAASYFCTNEDQTGWSPISLENVNKNTNIIIDWTLTITNINKQ